MRARALQSAMPPLRTQRTRSAPRPPWPAFYSHFAQLWRQSAQFAAATADAGGGGRRRNRVMQAARRFWRRLDATKKRQYGLGGSEATAARSALRAHLQRPRTSTAAVDRRRRRQRPAYVFRSRTKRLNAVLDGLRDVLAHGGETGQRDGSERSSSSSSSSGSRSVVGAGAGAGLAERVAQIKRLVRDWQRNVVEQL